MSSPRSMRCVQVYDRHGNMTLSAWMETLPRWWLWTEYLAEAILGERVVACVAL